MRIRITVDVDVVDRKKLRDFAHERFLQCWGGDEGFPEDAAGQVLEALVLSNANPSPADYGIAIADYRAERVAKSAPAVGDERCVWVTRAVYEEALALCRDGETLPWEGLAACALARKPTKAEIARVREVLKDTPCP